MSLRVFTFAPDWGLPTVGPFALKLLAWLELAGIPYEQVVEGNPRKGPKGKNPWIELDGELPLNTFGGSLGTGRIHGLWHIIEGALQASGRAGSRQVKDANVSFVGASAPIVTGTTFIFVGEPY